MATVSMERVEDPASLLTWLADRPDHEALTGYNPVGWESSTWILHAMYENPGLAGLGTHDDILRRGLDAGDRAPLVVGGINLDEDTTETGIPLGYVSRPGGPWQRVLWSTYLARGAGPERDRTFPPSYSWFPHSSWPADIQPPPEGSLDEESLDALLDALTQHSVDGPGTECVAFYASLPTGDFDQLHVWRGPLSAVPGLIEERGGRYWLSPTNLWPVDRSWMVWTDYDLQGSKVSGSVALIEAIERHPVLETTDWSAGR